MDFKESCLSSSLNSNYTRSENWYGLKRPGLKTGVENYIFLSEIGSGFGEAGDTRPQKILKNPPPLPSPPRVPTKYLRETLYQLYKKETHPSRHMEQP